MIGQLLTVEVQDLKPGDRFLSTNWKNDQDVRTETVVEVRPNGAMLDVVTDHNVWEMDTFEMIEVWRA